jgi:hypothetical protein
MPESEDLSQFFKVGGTLSLEAGSYIRRPADEELLGLTLSSEYCNLLTARQMGKSSLMVRTAHSLKEHNVRTSIIDLTAIGTSLSPSEWYFGLLNRLTKDLKLDFDLGSWWSSHDQQSPVQRFSDFLRHIVLEQVQEPIVVFIDEIDTTLKLDFTDDFFAAVRAAYNARASDPVFKRLSFVLLGVVRPADLIKERTRTPYNIGVDLDMTDFQIGELNSYVRVMETIFPGQGIQTIKWILDWTGGQPYLTQKICSELVSQAIGRISEVDIDFLVEDLFLSEKARTESNLRSIRDRALGIPDSGRTLRLYRQVLRGRQIIAQERSVEQNELKLTGLVGVTPDGYLRIRNRIYRRVFDQKWASDNIRATTFQKVAVVMTIVALAAIVTSAFLYWRSQNQAAEVLAKTYSQAFQESASPEVRLTNLAGLFGLGGDYQAQARQLFFEQSRDDQLALFQLASPQNVGDELVSVVEGLYQYAPDDKHGNDLLAVMGENLSQVAASGAPSLATEIQFWLQARELAGQGLDESAVTLFERVIEQSLNRNHENTAALFEGAEAYRRLGMFAEALTDYDRVIGLDEVMAKVVETTILGDGVFADYWRDNYDSYANLTRLIDKPTEIPIAAISSPTPKPSPTLVPSPTLTATSLSKQEVQDFAEPILNSLAERTPDFEDDFSTAKNDMGYLKERNVTQKVSRYIRDGKLYLTGDYDYSLGRYQFYGYDFVLQFEVEPSIAKDAGKIGINFHDGYSFTYDPYDKDWIFSKGYSSLKEGIIEADIDLPLRILFLTKGTIYAVYMNDELVSFFKGYSFSYENNEIFVKLYEIGAHATIDNIKFWNLDE